jgi:hypothetical protein
MMLLNTESVTDMFDDILNISTLLNSFPTMTPVNMTTAELNKIVEMQLKNLPFDPHGIDAQLSFGKYYRLQLYIQFIQNVFFLSSHIDVCFFLLLHMSIRLFTTGMKEDDLVSHIISFASSIVIGSILDIHHNNLDRHLLLEEKAETEV